MIKTPIFYQGYIQWVYPWRVSDGVQYLMFGDHGDFCPVKFEEFIR